LPLNESAKALNTILEDTLSIELSRKNNHQYLLNNFTATPSSFTAKTGNRSSRSPPLRRQPMVIHHAQKAPGRKRSPGTGSAVMLAGTVNPWQRAAQRREIVSLEKRSIRRKAR